MSEPDRESLLAKYSIEPAQFAATGLAWDELMAIRADHLKRHSTLTRTMHAIQHELQSVPAAHSVRGRVKDADGLVAKIIRKRIADPDRVITPDNYKLEITDLIGLRVLHLIKEDWYPIHAHITETWDLHEVPIFYYREGDVLPEASEDVEPQEHPAGYRSVHYLLKTALRREGTLAEVQVRTLFEESWSEIDHTVRYPHHHADPVIAECLDVFNRLAGGADEMGSFVFALKRGIEKVKEDALTEQSKFKAEIEHLKRAVSELSIEREKKIKLQKQIEAMRLQKSVIEPLGGLAQALLANATAASRSEQVRRAALHLEQEKARKRQERLRLALTPAARASAAKSPVQPAPPAKKPPQT